MKPEGVVRPSGLVLPFGDHRLGVSPLGGLYTNPAGLELAALSHDKRMYGATSATGTAIAPDTAVPTTAAQWFLFNDEPDGGKDLYINTIFSWIVSGTAGLGVGLLACVTLKRQAAGPADYASSIKTSLNGGPFNSKAIFDQATTITGGTPAWILVAARDQVAAVSVGAGLVADVKGMFKVPPGHGLGINVLSPVGTTALYGTGVTWAE